VLLPLPVAASLSAITALLLGLLLEISAADSSLSITALFRVIVFAER